MSPASNNEPAVAANEDVAAGDMPEVAVLCEETPGKLPRTLLRRDIASGDSVDSARLIRFAVSPDGEIVPDLAAKLPGRGLWVESSRQALETAAKRNIFARAAKRQIKAPAGLSDLVHGLLRRRCLDLLGLARREGVLINGFEKVLAAVQSGGVAWLIEASDGAEDGRRRILTATARQNPPPGVCGSFTNAELSLALGVENAIHTALLPGRRVARWSAEMMRLSGFEPLTPATWPRSGDASKRGGSPP